MLSLDFLLKATRGELLQNGQKGRRGGEFSGVGSDSRSSLKNKIFVALRGANFDGHDFLPQAVERGAGALLLSNREKARGLIKKTNVPAVVFVPDSLKALQALARAWRQRMKLKLACVTGSSGKTTSRAFAQSLFSGRQQKTFASPKSWNNLIGVPLSILSVRQKEAFLIQEIGTSQPGEIKFLTSLCEPLVSAVTMLGPAHLEGLGSMEAIFREKRDIYLKSQEGACWLFNLDNPYTEKMFQELRPSAPSVLTFSGGKKTADIQLNFIEEGRSSSLIEGHIGSLPVSSTRVYFSGKGNLSNLMCACGLALGAGLKPQEIKPRLSECRLPQGRGQWISVEGGKSIFFDAYNANPSSMNAFFDSFSQFVQAKNRLFVLGDMRELGKDTAHYHQKLAVRLSSLKPRWLAFVGEQAGFVEQELKEAGFSGQFIAARAYSTKILSALKKELKDGDAVGIKASRSLRLEQLVFDLLGKDPFMI